MKQENHLDPKVKDAKNMIEVLPLVTGVPQKVSPNIVRLLCPNPSVFTGPGTNTYIVGDANECIIVDPGPNNAAHISKLIELYDGKVKQILVTHTHGDHSPGCKPLVEKWKIKTAGKIAEFDGHQDDFIPDIELIDGMVFEVAGCHIKAIATPGHASNHFCFLVEPDNMLLTGDHIMQGSTVVVSPPDGDMTKYMASLRRVQQLSPAKLAPAHGHVLRDPNLAVTWLIQHRNIREQKVLDHLKEQSQPCTASQMVTKVYEDTDKRMHGIAVRSLTAHLLKLVDDGQAKKVSEDSFIAC